MDGDDIVLYDIVFNLYDTTTRSRSCDKSTTIGRGRIKNDEIFAGVNVAAYCALITLGNRSSSCDRMDQWRRHTTW